MTISISQSLTAIGVNNQASFYATGGTPPYVWSIYPFTGPQGAIDASTGIYLSPFTASSDVINAYDTVIVTDSLNATAQTKILVGTPLLLLADVVKTCLGLSADQVWIWEQKIFIPKDSRLYVIFSVPVCKPYANNNQVLASSGGMTQYQTVNMNATVDIDIISRGPSARDRKEEVVMALNSVYCQQQQQSCGFYVSKLTSNFINLSDIDGAAIPYRYKLSVKMMYVVTIQPQSEYFGTFVPPTVITND